MSSKWTFLHDLSPRGDKMCRWWIKFEKPCHKYHFCRDKSFVVTNMHSSWQNTSFVATKVCLSRQTRVCHDRYLCCNKILSWQKYFVMTNNSVTKKFCCSKHTFVVTKDVFVTTELLSWKKLCLWQLPPMIVISTVWYVVFYGVSAPKSVDMLDLIWRPCFWQSWMYFMTLLAPAPAVTEGSAVQKCHPGKTLTEMFNLHCDHDHSNPIFSQDIVWWCTIKLGLVAKEAICLAKKIN